MTSLTDKIALLRKLHGESTQGEWRWQRLGGKWHLVAQDKWRHIVLSASSRNRTPYLTNLVQGGLFAELSPEHPDSMLIEAAHNHLPEVLDEVSLLRIRTQDLERTIIILNNSMDSLRASSADIYRKQQAEIERQRAALEFYANRDLYVWVDVPLARVMAVKCEAPWEKAKAALGESK